jgi:branched-chain amino acid transport system substrate-binding protein
MHTLRWWRWLFLVLVGWAGCDCSAALAAQPVRVGATVSESGPFATEVGPFRRLMEAWAKQVNAGGGLRVGQERRPLEVVIYDDRSDEATALRMYERLASVDRVHLLLGPYSSPLTFAASSAAETHRIPFVAICANSPKIYNRGFQWIVCVIDAAPRYTHRYWELVKAAGKARSVAFVVEDTLHPRGVADGARQLAEQAGLNVIGQYIAPRDQRDFAAVLAPLAAQDPDIVFVAANIPFAVQVIAQAREMGLRPREYHVIHHGGIFRRSLGEAAEYVTGQSYWTPGMTGGAAERFTDLLAQAGIALEDYPWSPAYMMAFEALEAALHSVGTTDAAPLMQSLKALEVQTIGGLLRFQPDGVGSINTYPSQIQQGTYRIVWPAAVATGTYRYPHPEAEGRP